MALLFYLFYPQGEGGEVGRAAEALREDCGVQVLPHPLPGADLTCPSSGAGISVSAGVGQAARGGVGYSDITTDAAPSGTVQCSMDIGHCTVL